MNPWLHPCPGSTLGSTYGKRELNGKPDWHNGIDFRDCAGRPVIAPADCIVMSETTWDGLPPEKTKTPNGNSLIIEIRGQPYRLALLHLERKMAKAGDSPKSGDVLGVVGNTGFSFGPHLHLSATDLHWRYLDPLSIPALAAVIAICLPAVPTPNA